MRNLTIKRHKSVVGCAMKDQVYIRDAQDPELTIAGVPCRKLGSIKNGEEKTFQIPEGEQEIFMIVDKVSKEYCNARAVVPAEGDVSLAGKHYFVYGSNPFRFDGAEVTATDKKNGRKGAVITICAVIIGLLVGSLVPKLMQPGEKVFVEGDFRITLTEAFEKEALDGFYAAYTSNRAFVFAIREEKQYFGEEFTLGEYSELVIAGGREDIPTTKGEKYISFEFTETPEDQELYYMGFFMESEDAFWMIHFATPVENRAEYREMFIRWADSIVLDAA